VNDHAATADLWLPESAIEVPRLRLPSAPDFKGYIEGIRGELKKLGLLMAGFSNQAELDVLDSVYGDGSVNIYTAPTYLALVTVAVGETDTAGTLTEANYTGYARKATAAADMNAAAAGAKANGNSLVFAACTAGSSTIIGWASVTSSSGAGTVIVYGTCTSTVISTTQTPATIAVGALSVSLD
jgi:hypothetical protein